MMGLHWILPSVAALCIFGCLGAGAPSDAPSIETTLTGRVIDAVTSKPIPTSQITTTPATSSVVTSTDGSFTIPKMTPGQYTLTVSKDAYLGSSIVVTLKEGNNTQGDILLSPLSAKLKILETALDFGSSGNSMNLTLTNESKVGAVTWKATADQAWITLGQANGTISSATTALSVSINRSAMTNFGNYSGNISITSGEGNASIPVSVVIINPNDPQLSLSPPTLDFGTSVNISSITVSNSGTGALDWTAVASQAWVSMGTLKGQLSTGQKAVVPVTISRGSLAVGVHKAEVLLTGAGVTQKTTITLQVVDGTPVGTTISLVSHTANSFTLGWIPGTMTNFASYKIYFSTAPGVSEMNTLGQTISVRNTASGTVSGLSASTTYYARVYICTDVAVCTGSNEVSVITDQNIGSWTVGEQFSGVDFSGIVAATDKKIVAWGDGALVQYDGAQWTQAVGLPTGLIKSADIGPGGEVLAVVYNSQADKSSLAKKSGSSWLADTLPSSNISQTPIYSLAVDSNGTVFYSEAQSRIWMKKANTAWSFRDMNGWGWKVSRNTWTNEVYANSSGATAKPGLFKWNGTTWIEADSSGNFQTIGFTNTNALIKKSYSTSSYGDIHVLGSNAYKAGGRISISDPDVAVSYDGILVFVFQSYGGSSIYQCTSESDCIKKSSPTSNSIAKSIMTGATTGWAVGHKGTILRYQ